MFKRSFDAIVAMFALLVALPLLLVAGVGIWLRSPGPILYRARRIGRDRRQLARDRRQIARHTAAASAVSDRRQEGYRGREFTLYKFRTMHVANDVWEPITAHKDKRVFPFGALLRATKIDELPQLVNVIKGDMALVGPRPEAPEIVRSYYTADDRLTLQVPPGMTSPGSLYYYTHCEANLGSGDVTQVYAEQLLPTKLAIDRVYLKHATLSYDLRIILRTIFVIAARAVGWKRFQDPPEMTSVRG
jgi:lipopolysaccharide/colanic/teichoic acid biosynthesis glycosyltransferase